MGFYEDIRRFDMAKKLHRRRTRMRWRRWPVVFMQGIMAVFTFVVLAVFPLYYHNYYFDILKAKYKFYWISVVVMAVICLIVAIVFLFVDRMEYEGVNTKRFFSHFRPENLKKQPAAYKF